MSTASQGGHFSYHPLFEYWKDDRDLTPGTASAKPFFKGRSAYLRLTRRGDEVFAAVSNNGLDWTETKSITVQFPRRIKVGVDAINTSRQPFTVEFSELKLIKGKR